jgi:hypothetical protein
MITFLLQMLQEHRLSVLVILMVSFLLYHILSISFLKESWTDITRSSNNSSVHISGTTTNVFQSSKSML